MKKQLLCLFLLVAGLTTRAQRFFFIEGNERTDLLLKSSLNKSAQYVTNSPLASDFIINTSCDFQKGSSAVIMTLNLKDSLTQELIYRSSEVYNFDIPNKPSPLGVQMAMESFINRNIEQFIFYTNSARGSERVNYLKARKDKT